ncbi:hypothetical protein M430DRAFT_102419 [Amorphotheca resinae ATCC 22711]|uniref:Fcf2 pre-rRNA processing C-terminal domain-containing protein n=1 Tax=Amorphotheca resinae ATCC 22711 TaxID=857342 RepID=A0A2T3B2B0_AMORE|nr:hypothetical protein M430DRAFT_102419 [Amorphotheca resinae ATCC 22711]PSS18696.1 hypothetical protein M430DRAFT_102419 [Amorphotheca resinae ATCC 22711]
MADEDLSDEQLKQLLKDAEQRLKEAKGSKELQTQNASVPKSIPKVANKQLITPYISTTDNGAHVDPSHLVNPREKKLSNGIRRVQDPLEIKAQAAQAKKASAGSDWFNLPATKMTPEFKRDLQLLRMRSVLDPKRHYKKESSKQLVPEFSQVGTIIEGPTEFFSARLSNKERKRTFVEEVLAGENASGRFRNKYGEIQASKSSGKKEYYKKLKAKRRGGVSKG